MRRTSFGKELVSAKKTAGSSGRGHHCKRYREVKRIKADRCMDIVDADKDYARNPVEVDDEIPCRQPALRRATPPSGGQWQSRSSLQKTKTKSHGTNGSANRDNEVWKTEQPSRLCVNVRIANGRLPGAKAGRPSSSEKVKQRNIVKPLRLWPMAK